MDRATVERAMQLQKEHEHLEFIPRPTVFWHTFHANDQNTRTMLQVFEAISKSGIVNERKIREELLMMFVCLSQTNRFRAHHMSIDLFNARRQLNKAIDKIRELETRHQTWTERMRAYVTKLLTRLTRRPRAYTP